MNMMMKESKLRHIIRKIIKEQEGPSYDEVWLKDKLGDPTKDKYEFDNNRGHIDVYPDLGDMRIERSSQFIRFKLEEGTIHFVHAFGYERGYDMLKSVLPELGPMGDSSYAGFMNVNTDKGTIPVDIDIANEMVDALRRGLDAEAGAQTDFYSSRGPTSGTIDESLIQEIKEYYIDSIDEIQMIEDALNEEYCPSCAAKMEEGRKKGKCKPSKGKRFAKRVNGKCRSFGQKGKAKKGGDRIRPGTKKGHAYCARSAKIKKCKNPPCANTLSRKKWKCQGSRSVPE